MASKTTIYSIAKELNMSPSMVSRALSKNGSVDAKKRELIWQTAQKYNYTPNRLASQLSKRNVRIGIIFHGKFEPVINSMIDGIKAAYEELKDYKIEYEIKCVWAWEKPADACRDELFSFAEYDGVIVSGFSSQSCEEMLNAFLSINPNLVFLQTNNDNVNALISSIHDVNVSSSLACELLAKFMKYSQRKNVLLFTGDTKAKLHANATRCFVSACQRHHLTVLDCINMYDKQAYFEAILPQVMEKYGDIADGIYITSAISQPLIRYIQGHNLHVNLITFDLYEEMIAHIRSGTIAATIFQNVYKQAKNAFENLVKHLILEETPSKKIYTDVQIVMESNLHLYYNQNKTE